MALHFATSRCFVERQPLRLLQDGTVRAVGMHSRPIQPSRTPVPLAEPSASAVARDDLDSRLCEGLVRLWDVSLASTPVAIEHLGLLRFQWAGEPLTQLASETRERFIARLRHDLTSRIVPSTANVALLTRCLCDLYAHEANRCQKKPPIQELRKLATLALGASVRFAESRRLCALRERWAFGPLPHSGQDRAQLVQELLCDAAASLAPVQEMFLLLELIRDAV